MRGSHQMPLMLVPLTSEISYFDGPPIVSCAAKASSGAAMLSMSELEYTGIVEQLKSLDKRFTVRA